MSSSRVPATPKLDKYNASQQTLLYHPQANNSNSISGITDSETESPAPDTYNLRNTNRDQYDENVRKSYADKQYEQAKTDYDILSKLSKDKSLNNSMTQEGAAQINQKLVDAKAKLNTLEDAQWRSKKTAGGNPIDTPA